MPTPTMDQIKQEVNKYFSIPTSTQAELEDLDYCDLYHDLLSFKAEVDKAAEKEDQEFREIYDLPF